MVVDARGPGELFEIGSEVLRAHLEPQPTDQKGFAEVLEFALVHESGIVERGVEAKTGFEAAGRGGVESQQQPNGTGVEAFEVAGSAKRQPLEMAVPQVLQEKGPHPRVSPEYAGNRKGELRQQPAYAEVGIVLVDSGPILPRGKERHVAALSISDPEEPTVGPIGLNVENPPAIGRRP
jgi:hypothetical protein